MKYVVFTFLFLSAGFLSTIFAADSQEVHDTVYLEQIIRDTVYIPLKPKTDTIYIKKDVVPPQNETAEISNVERCCSPTADNPLGRDTTMYPRNDSSYTQHLLYLHLDLASLPATLADYSTSSIGGALELSFSRKNSITANYRYTKKVPVENGGEETFNDWRYSGDISQHDIGLGWRHYTRPTRSSFFTELGVNYLKRSTNYINKHEDWRDSGPRSDKDSYNAFQPYLHLGHIVRGSRMTIDIEYGLACNLGNLNDSEIFEKHFMYITSGWQLDFKINLGVGIL